MAEQIEQEDQELLNDLENDNEHFEQVDNQSEKESSNDETQTKGKAEPEKQPAEPEERVVTEEDIQELRIPQTFLGKPYNETLKTLYVNIRSLESKNSKEIDSLQKQLKGFEEQLTKKEVTKAEEVVEEKLPDYETEKQKIYDKYLGSAEKFIDDDGYTDRKSFSQALKEYHIALTKFDKDYQDKHDKLLKVEFKKMLDENSKPFSDKLDSASKTAQDIQEKENQIALVDNVVELLSEVYGEDKVDQKLIQSVFKEYENYAKDISSDMTESEALQFFGIYKGKPAKLAKEVIRIHKANLHGKKPEKPVEQKVEDIHNNQVNKLKKQSKTFIQSATAARDKATEDSDPEYDEILKEAEEDRSNWMEQITAGE